MGDIKYYKQSVILGILRNAQIVCFLQEMKQKLYNIYIIYNNYCVSNYKYCVFS